MSVQFTATTDWLDRATAWDYNAVFTISAWVRPQTTSVYETYATVSASTGNPSSEDIENDGANPNHFEAASEDNNAYTFATSASTYSANTWVFLAVRRISVTQVDLTVNGSVVATSSAHDVSARNASDQFAIASWAAGAGFSAGGVTGRMAQVRIWTTNLSDGELATEKASATAVKSANLWAEYRLVNAAGATTDSSGNGRTLTSHGSPSTGADDPVQGATAAQEMPAMIAALSSGGIVGVNHMRT